MPRTTCTIRSLCQSSSGSPHGRSRNVGCPGRAKSWNDLGAEAMALYESSGYSRIESFGHYKWSPLNRCYAKRLSVVEV